MGKESSTNSRRLDVGNTAAFYLRRSAIHERGEDTSIDYQREACERIAAQHGLEVVDQFNEGSGRSASHFKENERPEYDKALAKLGSSYTTLIAYSVDRLTRRGMGAVGHLLDTASAGGGRIITNDGLDTANDSSRMVASFMSEMARSEMVKLSERVCAAKEQHRREGRYLGGSVPYGLLAVRSLDKATYLQVDPVAAAVIVKVVDRLIDGATLAETCRWLIEEGHRTTSGALWTPSNLSRLIRSPHLVGHLRQNRTQVYRDADGNPVEVTAPIISEAKFARVDKVLKTRRKAPQDPSKPTKFRNKARVSLLGGLITCGDCGEPMTAYWHVSKGKGYGYYICRAGLHDPLSVRRDEVEAHVARRALDFVERLDPDSTITAEVASRLLDTFSPEQASRRSVIEDEIGVLNSRLDELQRAHYELGDVPKDRYERMSDNLTMKRNGLEVELATLPEVTPDLGILSRLTEANDDPADDPVGPGSAWADLDHHRRRSLIRCLVDGVTIARRPKPSDDIWGRTDITYVSENNVIQMAQRPEKKRRYSTAPKVAAV